MSLPVDAESRPLAVGGRARNETAVWRANIYLILARCFRPPEGGLAQDLELLVNMLGRLYPRCLSDAEALGELFQAADPETLLVHHAKLFVGPYDLLAPPYGSVYLDEGRRVMGESTMHAAALYARAGLSPDPANHEPPDHISTALEFMYFLEFQQACGQEQRLEDLQRKFLLNHLGRWVGPFTVRILAGALGGFYAALAQLTDKFIALEMDRLSG